jgi:hypothetical protein
LIHTATTWDTTTATMTSGMRLRASERKKRLGNNAAVIGIFSVPAIPFA